MKPESPYVAIRNTSKTDYVRFHGKVAALAAKWNKGNPFIAFEKKRIDLNKIEKPFLGLSNRFLATDPQFMTIQAID